MTDYSGEEFRQMVPMAKTKKPEPVTQAPQAPAVNAKKLPSQPTTPKQFEARQEIGSAKFPTLFEIQLKAIQESMARHRGNKTRVARELDINVRTVRYWMSSILRKTTQARVIVKASD